MKLAVSKDQSGIALISVLFMIVVLTLLLASYFQSTRFGLKMSSAYNASNAGFFSAEAGLNIRAEEILGIFNALQVPGGDAPIPSGASPNSIAACEGTNVGTLDFACRDTQINDRTVTTYVENITGGSPEAVVIPPGDPFPGLTALEYRYDVQALSKGKTDRTEAIVGLRMKVRQIPVFQFLAFFEDDIEVYNAGNLHLDGPIHSNSNIFLAVGGGGASLKVDGPVSAGGDVYVGRKFNNRCNGNRPQILDPNGFKNIPGCGRNSFVMSKAQIDGYNGNVEDSANDIELPGPDAFEMGPQVPAGTSTPYWDNADIRAVMKLTAGNTVDSFEIQNVDGSVDTAKTDNLAHSCAFTETDGSDVNILWRNLAHYDFQTDIAPGPRKVITFDVDMRWLLKCASDQNWVAGGLAEEALGGLVIYLGIDGPDSLNQGNNYAVRVKNAGELLPQGGGVRPKGLTVVTSQPIYVIGDYNAVNKIPAAIFSDRFNALSNNWADVNPAAPESSPRTASDTTYNMALISGVPKTGGANGPAGISNGAKNGGLQNFLLKHEKWAGKLQTYRGAFVSFGEPQKNNGIVDFRFDSAPNRNYGFDKDFFDSDKLPPMTPVFTYNRQELFVRSFTQE